MLTGTLLEYQEPVVDAALARGRYLIAADMGTGKTAMAIAVAEELLGCGDITTCLIVVISSLKYQWARELAKFTDLPVTMVRVQGQEITVPAPPRCVIVDGKPYQKDSVKYPAASDRKRQFASITPETEYVIVSYDSILDDSRLVRKIKPGLVICDEVTQIKSFRAKRAKQVKKILDSEYRLGLTGTPIENGRPEELFSVMEWVDDTVLGRWDIFDKAYVKRAVNGQVKGYKNLPVLLNRLAPAMSRLSRHDPGVREYLPEVDDDTWEVPLEGPVRAAYMAMGRRLHAELKNAPGHSARSFSVADYYGGAPDESTRVGKIMAVHTAMEMLLDHPDLVIASGMAYEGTQSLPAAKRKGSKYSWEAWQDGMLDDVWDSPKLAVLKEKVSSLLAFGGKVLVYTKYASMLDLLEDALGVPCVKYHGGMTPSQKAGAVARYAKPQGPRVFLSSHAGAYGCDMKMADHLVNYDNPWQAGRADQVNARHVRASSEFDTVWVHRMVVTGTIEERILDVQDHKRRVSGAIIDGRGADRMGRVMNDVQSLTNFLEDTIDSL